MASFTIGGNVIVKNCTGQRGIGISGTPTNTTVDGNFICTGNAGECVLDSVTVKNNVQVDDNGSGIVASTTIGGNLECRGNTGGVSDLGFTNSVSGPMRWCRLLANLIERA